jgi:hypothetical protein
VDGRNKSGHDESMTEQLTPDHFRPHVDKVFRVNGTHHAFTLTRIETRRREDWEPEMGLREPFNLIFRGPPGDVLREGLYVLEVEDGPSFTLYVIPVHTPARERQDYQAAFN